MSLISDVIDARMNGLRAEISVLKDKWMEINEPRELESAYEQIIARKEAQYEVLESIWTELRSVDAVTPRSDFESAIGSLPEVPSLSAGGSDE